MTVDGRHVFLMRWREEIITKRNLDQVAAFSLILIDPVYVLCIVVRAAASLFFNLE
jgi:hypothetical protein